jgi:hypothetical protein
MVPALGWEAEEGERRFGLSPTLGTA